MADIALAGGGENLLIFRAKANHAGVAQADGTTTATTNAHAVVAISTSIVKSTFTTEKITFEVLKNDAALRAFIKEYVAEASSNEVDGEVVYGEKGTKWDVDAGVATGGADELLFVWRGAANADGIQTVSGVVTLDADAINFTTEHKKFTRKTLNFTPVAAKAAISIANGLLPTPADYDTGASMTIPIKALWEEAFLDAA